MKNMHRFLCLFRASAFVPLLFVSFAVAQNAAQHKRSDVVDLKAIVRLFFQPGDGSYFHPPLLFRAVSKNDPRENTAPILKDGRTVYISPLEMKDLIQALSHLDVRWKHLGIPAKPPTAGHNIIDDLMQLDIYTATGVDRATLDPKYICSTLSPLDSVFTTPRALWEFRFFRFQYHCKIAGFNPNAYPMRDYEDK